MAPLAVWLLRIAAMRAQAVRRLADQARRQFVADDGDHGGGGLAVDRRAGRRFGHAAAAVAERHRHEHVARLGQAALAAPAQLAVHRQPELGGLDGGNRGCGHLGGSQEI
jgi:hypothetical protein